jgi:hypothetical protein
MRTWLRRSRPHQWLMGLASVLLVASILFSQINAAQERNQLRAELDCRSRVAGVITVAQGELVKGTGRGLVYGLVRHDEARRRSSCGPRTGSTGPCPHGSPPRSSAGANRPLTTDRRTAPALRGRGFVASALRRVDVLMIDHPALQREQPVDRFSAGRTIRQEPGRGGEGPHPGTRCPEQRPPR